jgi:hypothetical protein
MAAPTLSAWPTTCLPAAFRMRVASLEGVVVVDDEDRGGHSTIFAATTVRTGGDNPTAARR